MMSVEMGAGLAFIEKIPIYFYKTEIDKNRTIHPSGIVPEKRKKLYLNTKMPTVFDLIEIPSVLNYSINNEYDLRKDIFDSCLNLEDLLGYYYK